MNRTSYNVDKSKWGRWRIESASGHVVFLFAEDLPHAIDRWQEFYPHVEVFECKLLW